MPSEPPATPPDQTDRTRPASEAVPFGIRVASQWAARLLVIGVGVYALLWFGALLSEVTIPLLVAVLLAALLEPVFKGLDHVLPRGLAAFLTVIGTLALIVGLLSFVGTQFASQFQDISSQVVEGINRIRTWLSDTFNISNQQFNDYIDRAQKAVTQNGELGTRAASAGLTVGHVVAGFFIAMFALFFFLYDGPRIWGWLVRLFPRQARANVVSSGRIAWGQLGAFTRATILVAAADAAGIGLGAVVFQVPFAAGIALLVFFGAFVPVVGAFVSGLVAILLALVAHGIVTALFMLAVVIGVQQLEAHVLQPFLLGRAVRVHPLAVILAIAVGIILGGIVGALIAVPAAAVANAVGHHLLDRRDYERAEDLLAEEERAEVREEIAATEAAAREDE